MWLKRTMCQRKQRCIPQLHCLCNAHLLSAQTTYRYRLTHQMGATNPLVSRVLNSRSERDLLHQKQIRITENCPHYRFLSSGLGGRLGKSFNPCLTHSPLAIITKDLGKNPLSSWKGFLFDSTAIHQWSHTDIDPPQEQRGRSQRRKWQWREWQSGQPGLPQVHAIHSLHEPQFRDALGSHRIVTGADRKPLGSRLRLPQPHPKPFSAKNKEMKHRLQPPQPYGGQFSQCPWRIKKKKNSTRPPSLLFWDFFSTFSICWVKMVTNSMLQ